MGDRVLAADPITGERSWKRVVRVYRRTTSGLWRLGVREADRDRRQWIETTEEHPFWVEGRGWVQASELRLGDSLRQADGRMARLIEIDFQPMPQAVPVFNLETEDLHTYFVAADATSAPLLVHNCDAESLKKLYHYTAADPQRVVRSGLVPGASGKVYLTPNGSLSPLQAQLDLALPPNRGLPQHLLEIDVKALRELGIEIPEVRQVGRNYNMPGGELETAIPEWIPPAAIRVVK